MTEIETLETRAAPALRNYVAELMADLDEVADAVEKAGATLYALEGFARPVSGLPNTLKKKAMELGKITEDIREESASLERKLIGTGGPEIRIRSADDSHHQGGDDAAE